MNTPQDTGRKVLIIGGGIGGLAAALALARKASASNCWSRPSKSARSAPASSSRPTRSRPWTRSAWAKPRAAVRSSPTT